MAEPSIATLTDGLVADRYRSATSSSISSVRRGL
jgi:hypothetical protein